MRSHALLPHTADARVAVAGDTLPELFLAALEALAEVQRGAPPSTGAALPLRRRVRVAAEDATALLVDFLSEVLAISQVERAVFERAEFIVLDERHLEAEIAGRPEEKPARDVKAVTYHEADVRQDAVGHFGTHVVFDL